MTPHLNRDTTTAAIAPALVSYAANMPSITDDEAVAEVDEPPERNHARSSTTNLKPVFSKTTIQRNPKQSHASLLTQALQSQSDDDDETTPDTRPRLSEAGRRRSMTSTISLASTADLTSDTGLTSPSRTSTPSPPLPEMRMLRLSVAHLEKAHRDDINALTPKDELHPQVRVQAQAQAQAPVEAPPKRKSISFACAAKPNAPAPSSSLATAQPPTLAKAPGLTAREAPRRPCIKFACPMKRDTPPARRAASPAPITPPRQQVPTIRLDGDASPSTARKPRSPALSRSPRPMLGRRASGSVPPLRSKKYLTANSKELTDCGRFHEFASDEHREDDWIRYDVLMMKKKLTINDTLIKENAIRKQCTEAEEEAEAEEEEEEELLEADRDPENMDEDDEAEEDNDEHNTLNAEDDEDDHLSGYDSDDGSSGGYHTDEETGFADSDEDDEDGLHLWTPGRAALPLQTIAEPRMPRRSSIGAIADPQQSDSSIASRTSVRARRGSRTRHLKIRPGTPELPDSTDFVCGTLDEDRPMEDAYISCIAQRKREKMQLIPQDIDPSFPASDPENEEDEEYFNPVHHRDSDDNDVWLHGEMEDLHHDQDRRNRRKKSDPVSPKRYHSPPPKQRHHSPPPKTRGRSPAPARRLLFDRHSPRPTARLRSPPAAMMVRSPPASPRNGANGAIAFKDLGSRPCLTGTKSLPRPPALFPQLRKSAHQRGKASQQFNQFAPNHVRGAIDIVKGLQQKQQRRKEKFYQMYCHRARKGQIPERKPQPGLGAERMRELGLLMAGKLNQQGNYVLSI